MLAMVTGTTRGVRYPTSSLTTIATVRRFDVLAPTGTAIPLQFEKVAQCIGKNADC